MNSEMTKAKQGQGEAERKKRKLVIHSNRDS